MIQSKIFLPIITRNSINNPSNNRMNFATLTDDSPCDNVLLEYKLSLELLTRGLLNFVYPLIVGDLADDTGDYSDFFQEGCYPDCSDVVTVDAVEINLHEHLNRLCLGTPLVEDRSVRQTLAEITKRQGKLSTRIRVYLSII